MRFSSSYLLPPTSGRLPVIDNQSEGHKGLPGSRFTPDLLALIPEHGLGHAIIVGALVLIYLTVLLASLRTTSVTTDEFGHLPLAYGYLKSGDSRWLLMNPPSQRLLAALPLLFCHNVSLSSAPPKNDLDFWIVGRRFMNENRGIYQSLYMKARAVVALLACITGLLIYGLARCLGGRRAGVLALILFAFSPDLLAHGGLVTTDLSAALATIAVVFFCLRYCRHRSALGLLLVCLSVSLLFLSKFNALYFLILVPVMLFAGHKACLNNEGIRPAPSRVICELLLIFLFSWVLLCGVYRFEGLFVPIHGYPLKSGLLAALQSYMPWMPVPLPSAYFHAIDLQLYDASRPWLCYLFGHVTLEKNIWYYPICLLFKSPLALLVLLAICPLITRWRPALWSLIPGLFYFLIFLVMPGKQYGFRLMLPAECLFIVFIGTALARPRPKALTGRAGLFLSAILVVLVVWYSADTLRAYPHYISYFNELVGGPGVPNQGYKILADSNLDWGQDWIRLAEWQKKRGINEVRLAYFGLLDPAIYGVHYRPAKCRMSPGYLAVSANLVLGIDPFRGLAHCFQRLRNLTPTARPGPSIWVYDLH